MSLPTLRSLNSLSYTRSFLTRLPATIHSRRTAADWQGRQADEHITNSTDELNVQASASQSAKRDRAAGAQESNSQATGEKDAGNQNEQAKKDHPEAPTPVIGMNDERGQVRQLTL